MKFGDYIREKRETKSLTLNEVAEKIDHSCPYLLDIEKNRRLPFSSPEKLERLGAALGLTAKEQIELYDLAGAGRGELPPDLLTYVEEHPYIIKAIRMSKEMDIAEKAWSKFMETMK